MTRRRVQLASDERVGWSPIHSVRRRYCCTRVRSANTVKKQHAGEHRPIVRFRAGSPVGVEAVQASLVVVAAVPFVIEAVMPSVVRTTSNGVSAGASSGAT